MGLKRCSFFSMGSKRCRAFLSRVFSVHQGYPNFPDVLKYKKALTSLCSLQSWEKVLENDHDNWIQVPADVTQITLNHAPGCYQNKHDTYCMYIPVYLYRGWIVFGKHSGINIADTRNHLESAKPQQVGHF